MAGRWRTGLVVVLLAVLAKGLAFLREPVIASALGASSSSDAYYLAIGLPFVVFNLVGLPFSVWVTARVAAVAGGAGEGEAQVFYHRALWWGCVTSILVALGLALLSGPMVQFYASGLDGQRLQEAGALARLGAMALPALVLQAVCGGRLFAEHRFATVYTCLAVGSLVGLVAVVWLTPHYGAAGALSAFIAGWWTTALALLTLSHRTIEVAAEIGVPWAEDLGPGVVYRAAAMQLFFQGSAVLVYSFASRLAAGEIAAALFASKVTMVIYETIVLTVGVLVFPRIARLLQERDERAVGRAVMEVLHWLVPVTVAFMMLLAVFRTELVSLIYDRRAFDERAVALVSRALLGYAPYVVGITLVEILHRAMVLRGRMGGYLAVFGTALLVNWVASLVFVPRLGVMGVALGSSIGVLAAGAALGLYAQRRLSALEPRAIALLIVRAVAAAVITLAVITPLRGRVAMPTSIAGQILLLTGGALAGGALFAALIYLMGYRWQWLSHSVNGGATG